MIGSINLQGFKTELQTGDFLNNIKDKKSSALCTFHIVKGEYSLDKLAELFKEGAYKSDSEKIIPEVKEPVKSIEKSTDVKENGKEQEKQTNAKNNDGGILKKRTQ
jgi:hypothetical protein